MDTIIIHALWWAFGFVCGFGVMAALALSSAISRMEETPTTLDSDEPEPAPVVNAELEEAKATAKFYQGMYYDLVDTIMQS